MSFSFMVFSFFCIRLKRAFFLSVMIPLFSLMGFKTAVAQYKWATGAMYYPGFLYAHTDDARNLESHIQGFELSLARIDNRDKYWNRFYKNAEVGYNFVYIDLGQPKLTGKVYALGANFKFRIAGKGKNYLALRLGTGIGYLTRKFDFYTNRQNMAIGSHWNGNIQLGLIYQTKLSERLSLKTGLGLTHYSNGSVSTPNLGINMPSLFLGFQMGCGKVDAKMADSLNAFRPVLKRHQVLVNYGYKEKFIANPRQFHIVSIGYRWLKTLTPVRRWYLGADLVWDPTHPYSHFLSTSNPRVGIDNSTELGILIGHRYDIGRFAMLTDVGFYILNPYQTKYFSYQRIGFRYELTKDWFLNGTLKVHYGTADYFEWGVGYKFSRFRK